MNVVDLLILLTLGAYAFTGYRNGALTGTLSILGFLVGAVVGAQIAKPLSASLSSGTPQFPISIAVLIACAVLGQVLGVFAAGRLRSQLAWAPARTIDSALGSVLSVVGVCVVTWMLALPLASSPIPQLSRAVRESRVVQALDTVMPGPVRSAYSSVRQLAQRNGFPEVFGSLQPTRIRGVATPDGAVAASAAVRAARASIVKVYASEGCDHSSEGSGFVFSPGRVMTNAHVVAGLNTVSVVAGGKTVAARVVLFDPARDVAVLAAPTLTGIALRFATEPAGGGSSAVVAGYPQDGPFDLQAARIRDREKATGYTIYGRSGSDRSQVTREIYSIRAVVRAGNSGGPLLDQHAAVLGVVFARAVDADDTAFVLTAAEVAGDARAGRSASKAVRTGGCL